MMTFLNNAIHLHALGAVILLCGVLLATTLVQQRSVLRSDEILKTIHKRVQETDFYQNAFSYIERRKCSATAAALSLPVWCLLIVVLFCSLGAYFGAEVLHNARTPSYILGGVLAADPSPAKLAALMKYQSETVFMGSMAFIGAYIWTITRLISRINNNDASPTTYYFLSIRILIACLTAAIVRHVLEALPGNEILSRNGVPYGLAALGFVIGLNPTLWIDEMFARISEFINRRIPVQRWPEQKNLPENMTLSMIQGLVDDKIERLRELDIDNYQKLAFENPIVIWLRTTYTLELVTDWVAQAQLCLLFENDKIQTLRQNGTRDIFAYVAAIGDPAACAVLQTKVGIPAEILATHGKMLAEYPAFQRLDKLRRALI